jgi:NAD(P)H-dependent flavin oxidoreductase YrpB (nitropropane dioxygenase family)
MSSFALEHPLIIQGGMGVGVSNWTLARAVSLRGQLGVVSGTGIDAVFVRRLQDGDIGGHLRRAMDAFPFQDTVAEVMSKYFRPDGRDPGEPYKGLPLYRQVVTKARDQITMLGSFAEVWLAKEGHEGVVGMNLLTKVQMPNLATLYGAMLAGVDYVLMGAGIPREIPGALDRLAELEPASLKLDVEGASRGASHELVFRPADHPDPGGPLKRPLFLPIISSNSLATVLFKKATGKVNGFIVEAPVAGGHNAPPRGKLQLNERGEPVYGERDLVDLEQLKELGLPFWLAGGSGSPEKFREARAAGAAGIQVGTLFAYCNEAGFSDEVKETVRRQALNGRLDVVTDAVASPTGFPFKVVQSRGTLSDRIMYEQRERVCDLGYLRVAYEREDGRLDYRCSAEPVETFVKKGGQREATEGRKCLCNALFAAIGQPQVRKDGRVEQPLLTSGDEINSIRHLVGESGTGYSAADVIDYLLDTD